MSDKGSVAKATDEVAAKLAEHGASEQVIAKVLNLGVEKVTDLGDLTVDDLREAGMPVVKARQLIANVKPAVPAVDTAVLNTATFDNLLPSPPDDESWLKALKTGGVLKVDQSTIVAAIRAALAERFGLYSLPSKLANAMEKWADETDEQVSPTFYQLRKRVTRLRYGDVFDAIEGLDGTFITEARKKRLLGRLNDYLWPAIDGFREQLKGWQEAYLQGAANPAMLLMALTGGGAASMLQPSIMQADTSGLRDAADAVKDAINRVFAGTGVQITAGLAYEAQQIKQALEEPRLPSMVGVANREQMLKKLGLGIPGTYPRFEVNLVRFTLSILELENQTPGQEEIGYLSAMCMLGSQLDMRQLAERKYATLG